MIGSILIPIVIDEQHNQKKNCTVKEKLWNLIIWLCWKVTNITHCFPKNGEAISFHWATQYLAERETDGQTEPCRVPHSPAQASRNSLAVTLNKTHSITKGRICSLWCLNNSYSIGERCRGCTVCGRVDRQPCVTKFKTKLNVKLN